MIGNGRADRLIQAALDGLALRQRVITDNVANVSTPGFKAARVSFEDALRQARNHQPTPGGTPELPSVTPQVVKTTHGGLRMDGNNVDLDVEMIELAQTNISYNAVAQLASQRLRLLRTVITDGR